MGDETTQPAAPETAMPQPSEAQYKEAAKLITDKTATSELDLKLYAGDLGVNLCGGLVLWNQYSGHEKPILERLAKAIEAQGCLKWRYGTLYGAARLFEQQCHLGDLKNTWPGLEYSHFRAVFGLPWDDERKLLDSARDQAWNVPTLIQNVAALRNKDAAPKPAQVRPAADAVRLLRRVADVVDDHDELAAALGSAGVDPAQVAEVVQLMTALESKSEELREQLSSRKRS